MTCLVKYQVWLDTEHFPCAVPQSSDGWNWFLICPDVVQEGLETARGLLSKQRLILHPQTTRMVTVWIPSLPEREEDRRKGQRDGAQEDSDSYLDDILRSRDDARHPTVHFGYLSDTVNKAGEMAQLIQCLLQVKGPESDPQHPCDMLGVVMHTCHQALC